MKYSKAIVLGKGFLGTEFGNQGYEVLGRDGFEYTTGDSYEKVLSQLEEIKLKHMATHIINCIGSADTRKCEDPFFWNETIHLNGMLPILLSKACHELGMKFVHISTGCVYDQNNEPQKEDGFLVSHCKYVVSKLTAEFGCDPEKDLIIRPRLYFSATPNKNNLLNKMHRFTRFLTEVNSYTSVETIVESVTALLENDCVGVYNVANRGYLSMVDIAKMVFDDDRWKNQISAYELKEKEGLFLVNNIMDISKLEEYYTPRTVEEEMEKCIKSIRGL